MSCQDESPEGVRWMGVWSAELQSSCSFPYRLSLLAIALFTDCTPQSDRRNFEESSRGRGRGILTRFAPMNEAFGGIYEWVRCL
jgi:hypothetical protein